LKTLAERSGSAPERKREGQQGSIRGSIHGLLDDRNIEPAVWSESHRLACSSEEHGESGASKKSGRRPTIDPAHVMKRNRFASYPQCFAGADTDWSKCSYKIRRVATQARKRKPGILQRAKLSDRAGCRLGADDETRIRVPQLVNHPREYLAAHLARIGGNV
jgi:hypothetical protein